METKDVISALSALAHPARLAIFKQLVRSGKTGMAAGELAESIRAVQAKIVEPQPTPIQS